MLTCRSGRFSRICLQGRLGHQDHFLSPEHFHDPRETPLAVSGAPHPHGPLPAPDSNWSAFCLYGFAWVGLARLFMLCLPPTGSPAAELAAYTQTCLTALNVCILWF